MSLAERGPAILAIESGPGDLNPFDCVLASLASQRAPDHLRDGPARLGLYSTGDYASGLSAAQRAMWKRGESAT